jgi:hypothetical protein
VVIWAIAAGVNATRAHTRTHKNEIRRGMDINILLKGEH